MTISRMGISSLMGYQDGGGVGDETVTDSLVDESSKKEIEDSTFDMNQLTNLLEQNDMQFQFKQYRNMLNDIAPPRPRATGYDLASALGAGLLAEQSQKFGSLGRGLGAGFAQFNALQKEIDAENRKNKQARDMTAFGLVANKKKANAPSAKLSEMFVNDNGQFYKSTLVGDDFIFTGPEGDFSSQEFYEKFKGTNMRPTVASENARYIPSFDQMKNAATTMNDERRSLNALDSYVKARVQGGQGVDYFANDIIRIVKTLADSKGISPQELAQGMAEGRFQGLIGKFRVEIVGPGVMTEFDAQRIIKALGGEPGALQNVTVMKNIMRGIFANKQERFNEAKAAYNIGARSGRFGQEYPIQEELSWDDSMFDFDFKNMKPEEATIEENNEQEGYQIWAFPDGKRQKWFKTGAMYNLGPLSDKAINVGGLG